jgi:hypothetical protein
MTHRCGYAFALKPTHLIGIAVDIALSDIPCTTGELGDSAHLSLVKDSRHRPFMQGESEKKMQECACPPPNRRSNLRARASHVRLRVASFVCRRKAEVIAVTPMKAAQQGRETIASFCAASTVVATVCLLSGCDGSSKGDDASAALEMPAASWLALTDDDGSPAAGDIDVGVFDLRHGMRIERRVVVENMAPRSIAIVDTWKSCGCASVRVDRPEIRPRERAVVEIVVSPNAGGPFDVEAASVLDDESALKLGVRGIARVTDRLSAHYDGGSELAGTREPLLVVMMRSGIDRSELPGSLLVRSDDGRVRAARHLSDWREVAVDPTATAALWMTEIELSVPAEEGIHFMTIALGESLVDVVQLRVVKEHQQ